MFDSTGGENFKFMGLDAETDEVVIGHHTAYGGMIYDATFDAGIQAGTDYQTWIHP